MNSWPIWRPDSVGSIDLYGHRSLPQIAARVTRTSASVGSTRWASGTSSTRTSPAPYMRVARMAVLKQRAADGDRPCRSRYWQYPSPESGRSYRADVDSGSEIREFLTSRRARITPEQAGLRTYGNGPRRVP